MSEYQYYEFAAVEQPLDQRALKQLRALSTRAEITSTSFINHYNWGNFRGDPAALLERYFDFFLYLANWGTHTIALRLPLACVGADIASMYCVEGSAETWTTRRHRLFKFTSEDEGGDWFDDGHGWLARIVPLRADLMRGELRCLYLGWLVAAQSGELDDDAPEPPRPPGLAALSAPLQAFVDYMRVDPDLLAVAVEPGDEESFPAFGRGDIKGAIEALADSEKTDLLVRLALGEDVGPTLQRRIAKSRPKPKKLVPAGPRRTVGELLAAARQRTEERERRINEREAAQRQRRLRKLARREAEVWREVEALIEVRQPKDYERAVMLLTDLRDASDLFGKRADFDGRLQQLRLSHTKKSTLIALFRKAQLI